jgi:hypothetical protein
MLWGSDCFESIQGEHYYVVLWPLIEVCTPFISPKPPLWDTDKVKVKYYAYNKKNRPHTCSSLCRPSVHLEDPSTSLVNTIAKDVD